MTQRTFPIDAANSEAVRSYIQQQFEQLSWWPAEGPLAAKEDFEKLPSTPEHLAEWCEKWLNRSQWRQLEKAVGRP